MKVADNAAAVSAFDDLVLSKYVEVTDRLREVRQKLGMRYAWESCFNYPISNEIERARTALGSWRETAKRLRYDGVDEFLDTHPQLPYYLNFIKECQDWGNS